MTKPPPPARTHLLRALDADLVGPYSLEPSSEELLWLPPSRWYLTGFLAPEGERDPGDAEADGDAAAGDLDEHEEATVEEPAPKQKRWYPASMGMSVLLPAGDGDDTLRATVSFARYVRVESSSGATLPEGHATETEKEKDTETEADSEARGSLGGGEEANGEAPATSHALWRRLPERRIEVDVPLDAKRLEAGIPLPDEPGIELAGRVEPTSGPGLPAGTRALSLFVVNRQQPGAKDRKDEAFLFQVRVELTCEAGFVPRPDPRSGDGSDWDERVADLQYRDRREYAVGHGASVEAPEPAEPVTRVRTAWLPTAEVRQVKAGVAAGVVVSMERLGELRGDADVRAALSSLPDAYRDWIAEQRALDPGSDARRETLGRLMELAEEACARIADGIELLANDERALRAFTLANQAMARAALQRSPERYRDGARPEWRLFQLAFVLLNLRGIVDGTHRDRDTVELIFFPTGGGKTEAYLGVIAVTLIHRRLVGVQRPDRGLGVAVMLRYTLRLLTLDQLGRAATLICALEMLRRRHPDLGSERFAVGLWVGRTATANTMKQVRAKITEHKNQGKPSPFPLTDCPWCGTAITPDSLELAPSPQKAERVVAACASFRCDFARARNRDGLPVVFVDEQVYRELPCFLVGTVDKFAMLPWRGETGKLFGRASWQDRGRFYGPTDTRVPGAAQALPDGLRPPELIVQDELHLIAGPLGTMVGLYETAIEELCLDEPRDGSEGGSVVRPKIIASTATARRARQQIRALFGRRRHAVFPPPGPDDAETFFSGVDRQSPGRLYLGVAATGQSMKRVLLRTYNALLAAAYRLYDQNGPAGQPADGYLSLVGYFNSLRELGGLRRLVEDEVRTRAHLAERRQPLAPDGQYAQAEHRWFRNRVVQAEPVELTSREHTSKIAEAKRRLGLPYSEPQHVDVCLASNMISVGVDIDRLGLMVVAGQPKTTAEYIQASSRVGRQAAWPGLVVTCFNVHKPRDRSHYERFAAYHQSFYRWVEAASLTPFSSPALDRGLAGTLVAMARLLDPQMTPPAGAMEIHARRRHADEALERLAARGADHDDADASVQNERRAKLIARGRDLLDAWENVVSTATREAAAAVPYSPYDLDPGPGKPLLFTGLDEDPPEVGSPRAKFKAPTSMRDVEPSVHLWLQRRRLGATPGA